jgi:hypothetical protein
MREKWKNNPLVKRCLDEAKMDDAVREPEKKNCTFLFKKRKIKSNARKRKTADDDNGKS